MGYNDKLKMEQNQLYLIKQLEKKLKSLKKVMQDPDNYNSGLVSTDRVLEIETRIEDLEKNSHEPQNYREKCDEMESRIDGLESEVKKILYAIGK